MSGKSSNLMMGLGVGCGVLVLVLVVGVVLFVAAVRDLDRDSKESERLQEELVRAYGEVSAFVPPADGAIDPQRVEIFLAVRDSLIAPRREMLAELATLVEISGGGRGPGKVVSGLKSGLRFGGCLSAFMATRNRALLARGMGPGEYCWLYSLAYYGMLDKPARPILGAGLLGGEDVERIDDGLRSSWREVARELRGITANHLAAVEQQGDPAGLASALRAELGLLEADPSRFPWEDGAPEILTGGLEPFRVRLEASYDPAGGPLEFMTDDDEVRFSF